MRLEPLGIEIKSVETDGDWCDFYQCAGLWCRLRWFWHLTYVCCVLSGTSMIHEWGPSSHSGLSLAKQQVNFDNILWVTCANNEAHVDQFLLLWMLFCQHDNLRHCQSFRVTLFLSAKRSHAELFFARSSSKLTRKRSRQFRPSWDLCQVWKNFFWNPSYMYIVRWKTTNPATFSSACVRLFMLNLLFMAIYTMHWIATFQHVIPKNSCIRFKGTGNFWTYMLQMNPEIMLNVVVQRSASSSWKLINSQLFK